MFSRTEKILKRYPKRETSGTARETVQITTYWFLFIPIYKTEEILSTTELRQ